jgi:hypothetical protein
MELTVPQNVDDLLTMSGPTTAQGLCSMRFILQTSQTNLKSKRTCKNYTGVRNIRTTDTGPPNLWIFPGQLNGSTVEHITIKYIVSIRNIMYNGHTI